MHELTVPVFNKEGVLRQWKEPIIVPIYHNGDKTNVIRGILLLSRAFRCFSNGFL